MTFARLRAADWVALLAAFALLLLTAADWYGTSVGDEARRIQGLADPSGALGGEVAREVRDQARTVAEGHEKNAWQVGGGIDRLILVALLATFALAVVSAFRRAAGAGGATALATALAASATALLVAYRLVQEPGFDDVTTVKVGAPLALVALGVLALASAQSVRGEQARTERAPAEPKAEAEAAA
jgi:hypothetical protein